MWWEGENFGFGASNGFFCVSSKSQYYVWLWHEKLERKWNGQLFSIQSAMTTMFIHHVYDRAPSLISVFMAPRKTSLFDDVQVPRPTWTEVLIQIEEKKWRNQKLRKGVQWIYEISRIVTTLDAIFASFLFSLNRSFLLPFLPKFYEFPAPTSLHEGLTSIRRKNKSRRFKFPSVPTPASTCFAVEFCYL